MPPLIPIISRLGASSLCFRPALSKGLLPITSIANASSSSKAQKKRQRDPYEIVQANRRRLANIERQAQLKKEREAALGDPVRGIETPFLKTLDNPGSVDAAIGGEQLLNHFLTVNELEDSLRHSYNLSKPAKPVSRDTLDPLVEVEEAEKHAQAHQRAVTAISRITSFATANRKALTRANIRRCIDTFGRHNTDEVLQPRSFTAKDHEDHQPVHTPRAGPDTGSSEVQVAILTTKIRIMLKHMEVKGRQKDKTNKRNLRLLVHRRQKLLKYLRRKERGGDRWQNLVDTLGLTDGTWKGEISL